MTEHISERMVEREVNSTDVIDSIENPLKIGKIKLDSKNRPSFSIIGERATIYINPENGNITTVHKTSRSKVKKLKGEKM